MFKPLPSKFNWMYCVPICPNGCRFVSCIPYSVQDAPNVLQVYKSGPEKNGKDRSPSKFCGHISIFCGLRKHQSSYSFPWIPWALQDWQSTTCRPHWMFHLLQLQKSYFEPTGTLDLRRSPRKPRNRGCKDWYGCGIIERTVITW